MMHSETPSDDVPSGLHTPVGSRRTFFEWVTGAVAVCIGIGLSVPLLGYLISPALKRRAPSWVDVGAVEELPLNEPKQLDYVASIRDGWMETKVQKAVWAVRRPDGNVAVFSPICTHLGCGYRWEEGDHAFKCPCHGSVYDLEGKVIAGPAPRKLDTLPWKVENGRLLVIYKDFKAGLPVSQEL